MAHTSLQVCMDNSEWLHGSVVHDERRVVVVGTDSTSQSSGEMNITGQRGPMNMMQERRLRPQHEQALKCPRCDSTHTKFCYYNNYSLSQPRYFCKTCRRYWTKGGSLRNVPVGGGCRKNKKVSSKKSADTTPSPTAPHFIMNSSSHNATTDLHLTFPGTSHSPSFNTTLLAANLGNPNFMGECKFDSLVLGNPGHGDHNFMENKFDSILGGSGSSYGFNMGGASGLDDHVNHGLISSSSNLMGFSSSSLGFCMDGTHGSYIDHGERLLLPYEGNEEPNTMDMKPTPKMLALDWQDQSRCSEVDHKDSFGYNVVNGLGSWSTAMNGYGSSTSNPLL